MAMTPQKRNAKVTAECTRKQWQDPDIRRKRIVGLIKASKTAWDDPLKYVLRCQKLRESRVSMFTAAQEKEIVRRYKLHKVSILTNSCKALAKEFKVDKCTIQRLLKREEDGDD